MSAGRPSSVISASRALVAVLTGQLFPLGGQHLVEHLAHPVEGAGEVAAALQLAAAPVDVAAQVAEPAPPSIPRRSRSRSASRTLRPSSMSSAELVDGCADVERRRERIGTAVPGAVPVAVAAVPTAPASARRTRSASVDRGAVDAVLRQPAGQVQPFEHELDRGGHLAW